MKNIILICAAGMSTSLMVSKMKNAAKAYDEEIYIEAMAATAFPKFNKPVDVLLLGPQIQYMERQIKAEYEPKGIKIAVIDMNDYGMMNGEKVLKMAMAMLQ